MPRDRDKCDTEALRKMVEIPATFPDDLGVTHNVRQRSYGSLPVREVRDAGESNTVDVDHAVILRQSVCNVQVQFLAEVICLFKIDIHRLLMEHLNNNAMFFALAAWHLNPE